MEVKVSHPTYFNQLLERVVAFCDNGSGEYWEVRYEIEHAWALFLISVHERDYLHAYMVMGKPAICYDLVY